MGLLEIMVLVLSIGYIIFLIIEKQYHEKIRKSFKHVILVNGIRGKSTTTRLVDSGLRNCGFRVFSKTTGTIPMMINCNNEQIPVKRWGLANIREQYRTMRKAYKDKAEILVIECMAVNPELQYVNQHHMLHADITLITNVRMDHIGDMGYNLEELADALGNTIPDEGTLIINDSKFIKVYKRKIRGKKVEIRVSKDYDSNENLETFPENVKIALEVARTLNLDVETFFQGMKKYYHDPCAFEVLKCKNTLFMNGFSINDPDSINLVYSQIIEKIEPKEITVLLNSRNDRPTRTIQHMELLESLTFKKLIITGSNQFFINRYLKKHRNLNVEYLKEYEDLLDEKIIFAIGNIGGEGMKILSYFKEKGEKYGG